VISALVKQKRMAVTLRFPYPTGDWADFGTNYTNENKHQSSFIKREEGVLFKHQLDTTSYFVNINADNIEVTEKQKHCFVITPAAIDSFQFTATFTEKLPIPHSLISFTSIKNNNQTTWQQFWQSGGAIDFEGSTDKRAFELERRIILSQYLTKIQCAGNYPPQETGLTYNSWYGKPHLEMHWWHSLHYALWGRIELLEQSLNWYTTVFNKARQIAKRQGYDGVRWQKMTDNNGEESPSSVGAFLIWQQPHIISFAEASYRAHQNVETLHKYKDLVFATADFMASYAYYDATLKRYILGKGVIAAQERFKAEETFNPTYELVYWHWALQTAQQWRERLHLTRNKNGMILLINYLRFQHKTNNTYLQKVQQTVIPILHSEQIILQYWEYSVCCPKPLCLTRVL